MNEQDAARDPDGDPMEWTGRADFDLVDEQGHQVGTVEIVIRIDHLSLWFGNRTLAVIDRETFREWLDDPEEPFWVDDVIFTIHDAGGSLTIDDTASYKIPDALVQHLVQVI